MIALGLLTSCAAETFKPAALPVACQAIPLKTYSRAEQKQVATEMTEAAADARWPSYMTDYGKLRAAVRACQGVKL
jgi:hypothetical protein